jgi:hypothetical protein
VQLRKADGTWMQVCALLSETGEPPQAGSSCLSRCTSSSSGTSQQLPEATPMFS